jgi:hypothetical protein
MSASKQETIKNVINVHETTATMKQVMKIQAMAKEAQVVGYSSGMDFVSPIIFDVNLPVTKKDAGHIIKELQTILDSWNKAVSGEYKEAV